jgi:hypothetical protein
MQAVAEVASATKDMAPKPGGIGRVQTGRFGTLSHPSSRRVARPEPPAVVPIT